MFWRYLWLLCVIAQQAYMHGGGFDACTAHMLWRYLWLLCVIAQRACMHGGGVRCMHCGVVRPLVHRRSVWFFESEVRVDP